MVKPPAFQFYVQDFVLGTINMTAEQIGGYMLLLCYQWDKGCVPLEIETIKKISKTNDQDTEIILKKFLKKKNGFFNKRLEHERNKQIEYRKSQSAKGKQGGRPNKPTLNRPLTNPKPSQSPSSSSSISNSNNYVITEQSHPLVVAVSKTLNISRLPITLSDVQAEKLTSKFPASIIESVLKAMENKKDLTKKYKSVYLTADNWCELRMEKKQISSGPQVVKANPTGYEGN